MENQSPHIPSGWIHMKFWGFYMERVRYLVGKALPHIEKRGRYISGAPAETAQRARLTKTRLRTFRKRRGRSFE
ncbi:MAG: hypothetical protein QOF89_2334 [Acidobacteriota bacterium]|jgi:hypothetical protein|nr:hypothetical protein [Acidobacteriota bacterium]